MIHDTFTVIPQTTSEPLIPSYRIPNTQVVDGDVLQLLGQVISIAARLDRIEEQLGMLFDLIRKSQ